jgi:hypothetical protein
MRILNIYLTFLLILSFFYSCNEGAKNKKGDDSSGGYYSSPFGHNTLVFDTTMNMEDVQRTIDSIFAPLGRKSGHFSNKRYALMFKPGRYKLDIQVGYFMQIVGLGASPDDVVIEGFVRSNSFYPSGKVLINFWRSVENLTIVPTLDSTNVWGVSQAAPMRRVHVKGNLKIHDDLYASGGFIADSKIDGTIDAGGGQQWYTRNTVMKNWTGGNWNIFFQGVPNAPAENWPQTPVTNIASTELIREKPYWVWSKESGYGVKLPKLRKNAIGTSWEQNDSTISIEQFYIARAGYDNSETLNQALDQGKHLLFTPGIYELKNPLLIKKEGTIVWGIGFATLVAINGNSILEVGDAGGVTIADLLVDAGPKPSPVLIQIGNEKSDKNHKDNPDFLFDLYVRVGGPFAGSAEKCLVINNNDVIIDHIWLWRADHGDGVGWNVNRSANGLVVNGDRVIAYGLFCEHFQEYQTLWNGEEGKVYFFQCEMPYDPPTVESWMHNGIYGYASYKVADHVKQHKAYGLGIYNVFYKAPVIVDQAIECPAHLESNIVHVVTYWLNGNEGSKVKSIINGKGKAVHKDSRKATW